jgi:uncharacterized protein YndB with AHSA1/START domain
MARIEIERTLAAPIERVFEVISDHAAYTRFPGITEARLIREGDSEPNGLGAVRELTLAGRIRFAERITAFERPLRMDYLITQVNLPLDHEGGSITLAPAAGGTTVVWRSTFTTPVPLAGRPLGAVMARVFRRGFNNLLSEAERLAASGEAAAPAGA